MEKMTTGYTEVAASETTGHIPYRVYRRRWLMLAIFMVYSGANSAQWIQYSIICNIVTRYYNVSTYAVDWTSIIFMLVYVPLIFPASYMLNKMGLRRCVLLGAGVTAVGSWLKCSSVAPGRFPVTLAAQTLVAAAQVFLLSVPPQLAATWFGSRQVSTACSLGVFGNQAGVAASFLLTPLAVRNHDDLDDVGSDLSRMFYFIAGLTTVIFIMVGTLFQDRPPVPPSVEATHQFQHSLTPSPMLQPIKRLLRSGPFLLLMATYAISLGVFNAFSTLLNQLILTYFEDGEAFAGRVGLVFIVGGMLGSVICGVILDRTHKFKETTVALYGLSALSMIAFTFVISTGSSAGVYITGGLFGACTGGYMPVGFEFGAEITYPESESTSAGLLLAGSQVTGIIFTVMYGALMAVVGDLWANVAMTGLLAIGTALTAVIKADLRRQAAAMGSNRISLG